VIDAAVKFRIDHAQYNHNIADSFWQVCKTLHVDAAEIEKKDVLFEEITYMYVKKLYTMW